MLLNCTTIQYLNWCIELVFTFVGKCPCVQTVFFEYQHNEGDTKIFKYNFYFYYFEFDDKVTKVAWGRSQEVITVANDVDSDDVNDIAGVVGVDVVVVVADIAEAVGVVAVLVVANATRRLRMGNRGVKAGLKLIWRIFFLDNKQTNNFPKIEPNILQIFRIKALIVVISVSHRDQKRSF